MAAAALLVGAGCSWFPLVDYPAAPPGAADEATKVIDLTFSETES
jgi:hypothetical protein